MGLWSMLGEYDKVRCDAGNGALHGGAPGKNEACGESLAKGVVKAVEA